MARENMVNERSYQFEWDEAKAAANQSTMSHLNWRPELTKIRLISARKATQAERRKYEEEL